MVAYCKPSRRSRWRVENRNESQLELRQAQSMTEFEILDRHTSVASIPARVETRMSRGVPPQMRLRRAQLVSSSINQEWTQIDTNHKQLAILRVHWCLFVVNENFGHGRRWFHRVASRRKTTRGWARRRHSRRLQLFLRSANQTRQRLGRLQRHRDPLCRSSRRRDCAQCISPGKI